MTLQVVRVLEGHTSPETAFLVNDYPYGGLRCRIRFWLEHNPGKSKGYRFCSQTENPKNGRWNNPKRSTYQSVAAAMYLDEKEHVQWAALNEYSDASKVMEFVQNFPASCDSSLKAWCLMKASFSKGRAEGRVQFSINGKTQEDSDAEKEKNLQEYEQWMECTRRI
jgi:hypothetical protein